MIVYKTRIFTWHAYRSGYARNTMQITPKGGYYYLVDDYPKITYWFGQGPTLVFK